jgi:hypothetical protein
MSSNKSVIIYLLNNIDLSILEHLDNDDITAIEVLSFKFLIKMISALEFKKSLTNKYMSSGYALMFKKCILNDFKCVIQFKLILISLIRKQYTPKEAMIQFKSVFDYAKLARYILLHEKNIVKKCNKIPFKYKTINDVFIQIEELMTEISRYGSYTTYKKLQFIANNYSNNSFSDIVTDLNEKAIAAFYNLIPFIDGEHLIRSIKKTIHNECINMIKFVNAEKRKRLHANSEGYYNSIISLEENGQQSSYTLKQQTNKDIMSEVNKLNTNISIASIIEKHGKLPRKKNTLDLIMLKPNDKFIGFLKEEKGFKINKNWDMDDIYLNIGRNNFFEGIREFLSLEKNHFYKFIDYLQSVLL